MALQVGDPAPDFTLPDQKGEAVSLAALKGQRVVIYFYPKDDTPGCTKEACNFRDRWSAFETHGIRVLGISKGAVGAATGQLGGEFHFPHWRERDRLPLPEVVESLGEFPPSPATPAAWRTSRPPS
jgi:peroxiredoxin Q/BCP